MTTPVGTIVTDGRVALSGNVPQHERLSVVGRAVRHKGQTWHSETQHERVQTLLQQSTLRTLAVDPPERAQFLRTYTTLAAHQPHVVSIHYGTAFDGAAREARVCRQLMHGQQTIDVYEAATLEGGVHWLLRGALALLDEGATSTQVVALLRFLETRMHTLVLTPHAASPHPWTNSTFVQRARSAIPLMETLWHFDPKQRALVVLAQGRQLHRRVGEIVRERWGAARRPLAVRHRGYKQAQLDAITTSLTGTATEQTVTTTAIGANVIPCLPRRCTEIVLGPTDDDLERMRRLVHDPIWWKGAA